MLFDTSSWSNADRAHFLAVLAHELTVSARGTYEVGTDGVLEPEVLRGFNELEHRVTASLRGHLRGFEGMPLDRTLPSDDVSDSNDSIIQSSTDYNPQKRYPSMGWVAFYCGFCLR